MHCTIGAVSLEAYHDRELDAASAARFEEHLGACLECRQELGALENESRLFESYAERTAREPDPGAWRAIRAAIEARPERAWYRGWPGVAAASAAAAAVLLAAALVIQRAPGGKPDADPGVPIAQLSSAPRAESARTPSVVAGAAPAAKALAPRKATARGAAAMEPLPPSVVIKRAEREYVEAIRIVAAAAEARKATLDPVLRSVVEANLEIVDRSIDATRRAYRAHPNDLDLAEYLLSAYSRKLAVLRELGS